MQIAWTFHEKRKGWSTGVAGRWSSPAPDILLAAMMPTDGTDNRRIVLEHKFSKCAKALAKSQQNWRVIAAGIEIDAAGSLVLAVDHLVIDGTTIPLGTITGIRWLDDLDKGSPDHPLNASLLEAGEYKRANLGTVVLDLEQGCRRLTGLGQAAFPLMSYIGWYREHGRADRR